MPIVGADFLELMRDMNEDNLPHTVILEKPVFEDVGGGVKRKTGWEAIDREPCRVQPVIKAYRTVDEVILGNKLSEIENWIVITRHDYNFPSPTEHRFRIIGDGWEFYANILGSTGPHTADVMRKWICKSYTEE